MDKKKIKEALNKMNDEFTNSYAILVGAILFEIEQKSKKTGKWDGRFTCKFRLLYATRKYGCSGIEGEDECLYCMFRS